MRLNPASKPSQALQNPADWLVPWRFGLILAFLIVGCFPYVAAGLSVFAYLDYGQFGYPLAFYHRQSFWRGEFPLWNPLSCCGIPFLAQWNTLTLYPLSLIYLLFPLPASLGTFCLVHLFLAGMGMYFLGFAWTNDRLAASFAGAVFAFSGVTWYSLMWPSIIGGLAWMPWVVLAMEVAWERDLRCLSLAGLAVAMQLLTGGVEVILLTWLVIAGRLAAELLRGDSPRAKLLGRTLAAGCLALGLSAVQLCPFLALLAHSQRSSGYANPNLAVMPLTGLANFLVPLFHCSQNLQGLFVQPNHWLGSYYLGTGTVLLASLAFWRSRNARVWVLVLLTVFSILMAFGHRGHIYTWVTRAVPLLGFLRFPIKFVLLAAFTMPLLAGFGIAWLQSLPAPVWARESRRVTVLALALLALMGLVVLVSWTAPASPGEFRFVGRNALARGFLLALTLFSLAALRGVRNPTVHRVLQVSLLVVCWLDVLTHNGNLTPTVPPTAFEADAARNFYKWDLHFGAQPCRLMESKASYDLMLTKAFTSLEHDTAARRLSQFFDFNLLDQVPKFDGFFPLYLQEFNDLWKRVYSPSATNDSTKLMDFVGVRQMNNPTNLSDWVTRASSLPLVTAGQLPVFANRQETLNVVTSEKFEPQTVVYLPLEARGKIRAVNRAKARPLSAKVSAGRWDLEIQAESPAMVVVAQTFYSPWHAYVDSHPTPLWRANYAFQGLEVPAGKHHVQLVYEDSLFRLGVGVSAGSFLIALLPWVLRRRAELQSSKSPAGQ